MRPLLAGAGARHAAGLARRWRDVWRGEGDIPWRAVLLDAAGRRRCWPARLALLAGHYHVLGTDLTGNDVLYQALKSIRTAFVIGTLATVATLPLAVGAGHPGGLLPRLGRRGHPVPLHRAVVGARTCC